MGNNQSKSSVLESKSVLKSKLTGINDVDMRIILSMDYKDMVHACSVDKYQTELCNNNVMLQQQIDQAIKKAHLAIQPINDEEIILLKYSDDDLMSFIRILDYLGLANKLKKNNPTNILTYISISKFRHFDVYRVFFESQNVNPNSIKVNYKVNYIDLDIKDLIHFLSISYYNNII